MRPSPDVVARFATSYRSSREARIARESRRAGEVLSRLPALAARLRREFGIRRLGYFGSLRSGRLKDTSDVDLYVRDGDYFGAVDRACMALGAPVDLVELEAAPDSLRRTIEAEGVLVDG